MAYAVNNSSVANESQEESKFAGVVFHNIQDVYTPGKDIRCCFSIKPSVSTTPNDWIGLYKVGWKSQKEYLCYEYSPVVETSTELFSSGSLNVSLSVQNSVVFCGSKLPTEECEFYQFCYVTSSGEIRGASYPFQISFTRPGDLEICSEEEDESLLVVNNRTTILEDSLSKANEENATLKASKETVEANCLKFQDMILILEGEKNELVSLNEKQKAMLGKAISEKTEIEESLKDSVEKLKTAQVALKLANDKTTEVQQQLDNERLQHHQTTSEQQKFEEERSHFLQVISQKDGAIQNFLETVAENGGKISALESEILKLKSENEAVHEKYDNVVVEKTKGDDSLEKSEQAYAALEKSHAEQLEEVYKLQAENMSMRDELGIVHGQLEEMSNWLSNQQSSMKEKHLKECSDLESQIETITSQLESCKQELAAADQKLDEAVKTLDKEQKANQELVQGYEDSIVKLLNQLDQERAFNNSLSSASDRQVAELQEQLNAQLQKNSSVLKKTEEQTQEIKQLEEKIKLDQGKIQELQQEIEDKTQQLEASKERENESLQSKAPDTTSAENNTALEGSYFALKTAHDQLRKQYLQLKKDMESVWRQKADLKRQLATVQSETPDSDLKFQMANLKKQIEDLRIRLNMGAEAYKAKFKECQKYEKQLKKIRKDSSGPTNPPSGSKLEKQNLKLPMDEAKTSAALNKSLEEYKQELEKVKTENDFLQREVNKLDKEACINNDEAETRRKEDKEIQTHIESLYNQLETTTKALLDAEKKFLELSEQNEILQSALDEAVEKNKECAAKKEELQQQIDKQIETIEELREMAGLVESVARHDESNSNQGNALKSPVVVESSRGPPPQVPSAPPEFEAGQQCPMCHIFFPPNCAQKDFEEHVNSHFGD